MRQLEKLLPTHSTHMIFIVILFKKAAYKISYDLLIINLCNFGKYFELQKRQGYTMQICNCKYLSLSCSMKLEEGWREARTYSAFRPVLHTTNRSLILQNFRILMGNCWSRLLKIASRSAFLRIWGL